MASNKGAKIVANVRLNTDDFVRSKTDEKNYRLLWLENGLEVLLVTDHHHTNAESISEDGDEEISEDEVDEDGDGSVFSEELESGMGESSKEGSHGDKRRGFGGCAVAMAVGVGSFHEMPGKEPHGLAHLLEHMLFMGSDKHPTENAYDDYLSRHGGFSNAFTEAECTMYC
jgi:nardilysin